jgi:hypothetical protein
LDVGKPGAASAPSASEFNAVVVSINQLVGQQQDARRERQLASEIAHDYARRSLASIALQAASLRRGVGAADQTHDTGPGGLSSAPSCRLARRAGPGHVVSQLFRLGARQPRRLAQPDKPLIWLLLPPLVAASRLPGQVVMR